MLRILRTSNGKVVFTLSGRIEVEDIEELHRLFALETPEHQIVLHLHEVTLVNSEAVKFLAGCEGAGIALENRPAYIRKWIDQQSGESR